MNIYNLESLQLPKLTGFGLRLFTMAVECPLTRWLFMKRLLRDGGIIMLREKKLEEAPTMHPLWVSSTEPNPGMDADSLESISGVRQENIPFTTIREYASAYRGGKTTTVEVARRIFEAVENSERQQQPMHAFIAMNRDDVMAQAHASDQRIKAGRPLSILDGVPIAVKDEMDQVPYPTTAGTTFMASKPVLLDSTVVARLRAAGALLIGKANMHEIGINPNGLNVHNGTVRNPYNLSHDPGGSSSGPAAIVAANMCPVAIGADGGGSIRIPSALCGLVGLKGTFGRVSEKGAVPLCWSLAHIGPLGATVEDVAIAYAAIAGADADDKMSLYQPEVSLKGWNDADLSGLRLGVYRSWYQHASPEVVRICDEALSKLVAAGGKLVEIEIPELDEMRVAQAVSILAEMAASMKNYREHTHEFAHSVRLSLALGNEFTSHDYLQAQRMRTRAMKLFADVFQKVDVIISPTTAVVSPIIPVAGSGDWSDLSTVTEIMRFVFPANLTGLPAISFPAGYDSQGLPVGMHVMAGYWQENLLLKIAYAAEQFVERKIPALHYRIIE